MTHLNPTAVAALHLDSDARVATEQAQQHLTATIQRLQAELAEMRATLTSASLTTHVHAGVPLRVDDTTREGGSWISVHEVLWSGSHRHANIWRNCHTGEWMLSISGPGLRSGGEIVADAATPDSLVTRACEWVATATR